MRRSPRSHPASTVPIAVSHIEAPTQLVSSHHQLRPHLRLSQAFRRLLYGTTQHRGILAGLAILKLYCECLGTTWTGNPLAARDPVVFFRTATTVTVDMAADTSKWQRLPAEFDKRQAKAYSFAQPDHSTSRNLNSDRSDRSSGLGGPVPSHGRPP